MKFKIVTLAILVTAFSAMPASASWQGRHRPAALPDKMKAPKPKNWDLTLTVMFSPSFSDGPCTGSVGSDYCPSGDCMCYTASGRAKGTAGTGSVILLETFDLGGEFESADSGCAPVYGDIEIDGSKDGESIAFTGTSCGSDLNEGFLEGGCQLYDSGLFEVGVGTCGGGFSDTFNNTFRINGKAE